MTRYGNRNFDEANTTTLPKECNNNTEVCEAIRPIVNPSVNTANNRLNGYVFDNAGNTVRDPQSRRFTYDGENKQVKVETLDLNSNPVSTVGEYSYDGDGRRIKKHVPSTGEVTVFVYDAAGKSIAEYSTQISEDAKVSYTTSDHLGSPRILTDENGTIISRRDFHPFGEKIDRPAYGADDIRKQFTGYERDSETGLDFAQARYFAYGHGRFSSPDNFLNDTSAADPASWNLYAFVRNNPLNLVDPSGERVYVGGLEQADRDEVLHRMNFTYGCNSCVAVDAEGYLTVDTSGLDSEIIEATKWLTNAINSTSWYGEVQVSNNNSGVAFGQGRQSRGQVPCEKNSDCAGKRRNADLITLDFGDDRWVSGDDQSKNAFLFTVLAHEIAHFYLNFPNMTFDPTDGGRTGPVVDAINEILFARNLPLRNRYIATGRGGHWLSIPHGEAQVDETNTLVTNSVGGIAVVSDNKKIINWIKKNVGGKGIN